MSTMSTKKQMYDIAVIGGGAAGMFSAGIAAGFSARVVLIEQNPFLGKKIEYHGQGTLQSHQSLQCRGGPAECAAEWEVPLQSHEPVSAGSGHCLF